LLMHNKSQTLQQLEQDYLLSKTVLNDYFVRIQQTANELNTAMGQLQHGIDDENATKQTQKYRDAEQSKKTAYDQAVAAAKAILNKQTGSNSDKAAVDRAVQQVTSTKDALNGDAKLAEAKAAARQNLGEGVADDVKKAVQNAVETLKS
ncbi:FIVAR domain-containing protein, partial [Staphylococcus aureus]|uniref:FIVAR domain-containing protein n=1 Tax=Staphylococcus aureus TaxID=1280 RepID=UPI00210867BF